MTASALVMVIDDDQDLRDAVCEMLSDQGYATISCSRGDDGLEYLQSDEPRPALILLDLMMPIMNGWEFRERQLQESALAAIPVVVMTASGNLKDDSIRAAAVILKPLRVKQLLEVVALHASAAR